MSKSALKIVGYLASAAFGAVGGYLIGYRRATKKAMADDMAFRQSLIDADRDVRAQRCQNDEPKCPEPEPEKETAPKSVDQDASIKPGPDIPKKVLEDYSAYSAKYVASDESKSEIHEISDEDYASNPVYEQQHLTLYADDILVDDYGEVIDPDDYAKLVGKDFKDYIGHYEKDYGWVRNKRTLVEYEIERSDETYYNGNGAVNYEGV